MHLAAWTLREVQKCAWWWYDGRSTNLLSAVLLCLALGLCIRSGVYVCARLALSQSTLACNLVRIRADCLQCSEECGAHDPTVIKLLCASCELRLDVGCHVCIFSVRSLHSGIRALCL